jgi:hypothetical protein
MNNDQGIFGKFLAYLFGANWSTTASGLTTIICAIIHDKPQIIGWIPEPFRTVVWSLSEYIFFAGATAFVIQAKAKNVTGGTVQQTVSGAKADEGTMTMVDQTLLASKASGEILTPEQEAALAQIKKT